MTVKELIKILQTLSQDAKVLVGDEEVTVVTNDEGDTTKVSLETYDIDYFQNVQEIKR